MQKNTKIILAVALGFVLLVGGIGGGIVYLVFKLTAPVTIAADAYLGLLAEHKYQEAYDSTASGFKTNTDEPTMESIAKAQRLDQFQKSNWSSRSTTNDRGTLMGSITLTNGDVVPLDIDLIEERGAWKVYGLTAGGKAFDNSDDTSAGSTNVSSSDTSDYVAPSDEESKQMAQEVLTLFAESVKDKSFSSFYEASAQKWQSQTTVADLDKAYATFIDSKLDFSGLAENEVDLSSPPTIKTQDQLVIAGTVADVPKKGEHFVFEITFIPEDEQWQLFGLDVSVKNN